MTKYKIAKEWADYPFDNFFWYVYFQVSFLGFKYWSKLYPTICTETKEEAESELYKFIEDEIKLKELKSQGTEEYFIEI